MAWVLEVISAHLAASNPVYFEHTLQSKDAEIVGSATLFQCGALQFRAKNYALNSQPITVVRSLKMGRP